MADLLSKRRSRSVARPRQLAMALSKELTNHSLPEMVMRLVVVIIRRCYMLVARLRNFAKKVMILKKIILI